MTLDDAIQQFREIVLKKGSKVGFGDIMPFVPKQCLDAPIQDLFECDGCAVCSDPCIIEAMRIVNPKRFFEKERWR